MSRSDSERFADIIDSIDRCQQYAPYLRSGEHIAMAHDAVLRNLAVIGEAVRGLSPQTREALPDVPWAAIAGLRNVVVHEYFRINPDLVLDIVDDQLSALKDKLQHL
jgi:uncharacterized protein with HEPN domain